MSRDNFNTSNINIRQCTFDRFKCLWTLINEKYDVHEEIKQRPNNTILPYNILIILFKSKLYQQIQK